MSADVDYYDVQRMVEDEARDRRIADERLEERLDARCRELREELVALERLIHARTEHLV